MMVRGCSWGYLQNKLILYLTHEWSNLIASVIDDKEGMLNTLLSCASCTRGITELLHQCRAHTKV